MFTTLLLTTLAVTPTFEHSGVDKLITEQHGVKTPVVVYVTGRISEGSAGSFESDMQAAKSTGQPIIPVVISSFGGSVYALLEMIDTIKNIGVPVATIVVGKAMSAGVVLASCGSDGLRFAAENTTFMVHEVSSGAMGKVEEVKADAEEAERLNKLILEVMSTNINKNKDYFRGMIHEKGHANWYFGSAEAKEIGLIDHVGVPTFKIKINVDVTLE